MLKVAGGGGSGGTGTVTNIQTGTGLTGGPITTTGTISLANTAVTIGTYGSASNVAQVTIDAQGRITSAANVAIVVANSAITGLGTMSTQNANAVAITGGTEGNVTYTNVTINSGNVTVTKVSANNYVATATISSAANIGAYSYGALPYTDTNLYASFQTTANAYTQMILHNSSNGVAASTDYVVSNDQGTSGSYYGDFGINSSTFSGTGNFQKGNAVYMYSASSDLSIGTWSNSAIHFIAGSQTNTDAMTINGNNTVTIVSLAQTTSATATFATSSLPLVPAGYLQFTLANSTVVKVPYYAN